MALSMLVLFAFPALMRSPAKAQSKPAATTPVAAASHTQPVAQEALTKTTQGAPAAEKTETVETDKFSLVFSDVGGTVKKIILKKSGTAGINETFYEEESPVKRLFAMDYSIIPNLESRKFECTKGLDFVEYRFAETGVAEISKRFTFNKTNDYIGLSIKVKNLSAKDLPSSYIMIGAAGMNKLDETAGKRFIQAEAMVDGKVWRLKTVKGAKERKGSISWVALRSQYSAMILKPQTPGVSATIATTGGENMVALINPSSFLISPGVLKSEEFMLYAGPLDEKKINVLGEDATGIVDYGLFGGVSKVLLAMMKVFFRWTGNWGVAIIILTIIINIVLFPLTLKSFVSMQQMKKVQPHVEKLKELHKDNPQRLNKEIMELYKKYNVNPLGGCLPLLLQMPIFIALYQALMNTIDLKGGKFLWIADLSRPDAVPLPVTLPFMGNSINVLPLLMAIGMFFQQKMSQGAGALSPEQATQQKMMMVLFPVLFGFMFYNMPSGLVLYWLTNTVLMTTEQGMISKRMAK